MYEMRLQLSKVQRDVYMYDIHGLPTIDIHGAVLHVRVG